MVESFMVRIADYPQLSFIAWNRHGDVIDEAEALALYERNWVYVDRNALSATEQAFIATLVERHGNGCFMPT